MEKSCSVVLAVFGRYAVLTYHLQQKIEQIKALDKQCEVIVIVDGPQWMAAPMLQLLPMASPNVKIVEMESATHLPAKLFNAGIAQASGEYVILSTLFGTDLCTATAKFQGMLRDTEQKDAEGFSVLYLRPVCARESGAFLDGALYGQCQTHDCLHIDEWCIPRALWEKMGGFHESVLLQEEFERYAALSFLRLGSAVQAGELLQQELSEPLSVFPFEKRLVPNRDLARRFAIYCNAVALSQRSHEQCSEQFLRDLDKDEMELFARLEGLPCQWDTRAKHYRVFVIGGYWEYHHNQLGFFNYLENLYGSGFATYNCGLDVLTQVPEIQGYDLVIFTRCRSEQSLVLMRYCKEHKIPSVYMIDDNWFSVAKDYPEHGGIFQPGKPDFDNFVEALSLCKATWVYNPVIRQDVLPYTANVQTFPISVCENTFFSDEPRVRTDDTLYVGFSGSLRWSDEAFRALARLARRRKDVKVLLAGVLSKEQEMLFTGLDTIRLPMTSYSEYARNLARLCPDLLLAPLEDTKTSHSKCANKYVEAGIVGAACIFSKQEPYVSVVKDGVNGFFVENDTDEDWYCCIREVIADVSRLREVQKSAQEDVMKNYSARQLCELFQEKISAIVEQEMLIDD